MRMSVTSTSGTSPRRAAMAGSAESKARGLLRGVGVANYVDTATGVPRERAEITVRPDGMVDVVIGTISQGQGHETMFRQIFTDGRNFPNDPSPTWLGYSVGKWDGDTFVVDTMGFNDVSWLDVRGHGHSEELKVQERFHRRDFGHMDMEVTVDDPVNYTRPFSVKLTLLLDPDSDVNEYVCVENERDRGHIHP